MFRYIKSISEFSEAFITCAGVTEEKCVFTSSTLSFQQTSSHTEWEGGTRGMSLEGSQTGNSSGCFHDLLVFLSAHVNVFTGASFRAYQWENHQTFFSAVHKNRALSPSCGGMTVKKKESGEVLWPWKLLTWMLFLHSWLWMIVSLLWLLSSAQWTDVFIVCVKQRLSADQIFTLASASMLGNTGGKTLWVWEKNFKHAETVKHKWAKRNNPERDGGRFWSLVLQTHCY